MKYCPVCGDEFSDEARFCTKDGSGLLSKSETAVPIDPFLGRVLAERYRVVKRLGEGGMGAVYLAENIHAELQVALKVLNRHASKDKVLIQRFEAERKIISKLRHPNILKLLDSFHTAEGELVVATEFVNGQTLEERIGGRPMAQNDVMYFLVEVFDALIEAHGQAVIHRDLKPSNIMLETVGDRQMVKILDFGIAKSLSSTGVTATGKTLGTPAYMSPEQVQGFALDARSDLYSMGVVAFEALSGRPPFSGENPFSIIRKHIQEPPPSLVEHVPNLGVTSEAEAFIFKLLAKKPSDRFNSAQEARDAARSLCAEGGRPSLNAMPGSVATSAAQRSEASPAFGTDSTISDEMPAEVFSTSMAPTESASIARIPIVEGSGSGVAANPSLGDSAPSQAPTPATDDSWGDIEAPTRSRAPGYVGVIIGLAAVAILWAVFFGGEADRAAKEQKADSESTSTKVVEVPATPPQDSARPVTQPASESVGTRLEQAIPKPAAGEGPNKRSEQSMGPGEGQRTQAKPRVKNEKRVRSLKKRSPKKKNVSKKARARVAGDTSKSGAVQSKKTKKTSKKKVDPKYDDDLFE